MSYLSSLVKLGIYLGVPSIALIFYLVKKSKENSDKGNDSKIN